MEHIRGILASPDFDKVSTPEVILSFYALILDKLMETLDACDIPKEVW